MRMHVFTGALAVLLGSGAIASAATLSLVGPTQTMKIERNDLKGLNLNGTDVDFISGAAKTTTNGLFLSGRAKVTYTYVGFEAANTNFALTGGTNAPSFVNKGAGASTIGATTARVQDSGLLDFAFGTSAPSPRGGLFSNAGLADSPNKNYAIGYVRLSDTSFLALFDDISAGDRDFDDLAMRIDIAAVPLPAGGLLLLGGLGGLALSKRRRKSA